MIRLISVYSLRGGPNPRATLCDKRGVVMDQELLIHGIRSRAVLKYKSMINPAPVTISRYMEIYLILLSTSTVRHLIRKSDRLGIL